jgi:hypothetical protein
VLAAIVCLKTPYRSRGSSASRKPSPTRLSDSTTRKIASPGQIAIHGALVRKRCAALSMLPQDGAGGCWPSPKNDSAASTMGEIALRLQRHVVPSFPGPDALGIFALDQRQAGVAEEHTQRRLGGVDDSE